VLPIFILLIIPVSVHAGWFSSIADLVITNEAEAEVVDEVDYSPINTPLLSASKMDPTGGTGGGDIAVVDGALMSSVPVTEEDKTESRSGGEISVYTVREGDSLSEIAEMYSVTSNTILWANDINKASSIRPGDTLVILPIVGVQHEVAKGETLASIVKEYDADFDEVLDYNNLTSADDLTVGTELMIPGGNMHTATKVAARPAPSKSTGSVASGAGLSHPAPGAVRTQGIHGYNAVDLAGSHGMAIRAAAAGEVIVSKSSGWNGGYGNYIVVRHSNGTQTLYAHLSANYVGVGAWVAAGETIAAMGNTGRSTGTHLHFEVRGGSNPF
jgi:LysM repeat protein